jgi:adenine-specific DNA-methyltransferase
VLFIRNASPGKTFLWGEVSKPSSQEFCRLALFDPANSIFDGILVKTRTIAEGLETGLSRNPDHRVGSKYTLADFAYVNRGIETGSNEFFYLTRDQVKQIGIPSEHLKLAVGRTRDVDGCVLDEAGIAKLDAKGRPTLLFAPDGRALEDFPPAVQQYLRYGESLGLQTRSLLGKRRPWYKMEKRKVPPILFAYLGRHNVRFIRNQANVVPLTGFLCVYPRSDSQEDIDKLWDILRRPETVKNLRLVAKTYGSGALKVEPRSLERLPILESLVSEVGLVSRTRKADVNRQDRRYKSMLMEMP